MKNFVFISPNFPLTYWKFCRELKNNGMRVLGIGDCPYDELMQELKDSLSQRRAHGTNGWTIFSELLKLRLASQNIPIRM